MKVGFMNIITLILYILDKGMIKTLYLTQIYKSINLILQLFSQLF